MCVCIRGSPGRALLERRGVIRLRSVSAFVRWRGRGRRRRKEEKEEEEEEKEEEKEERKEKKEEDNSYHHLRPQPETRPTPWLPGLAGFWLIYSLA